MKKFLLNENLPYLFTILIGLAAYQLNNIITTQLESPILAYSFKTIAEMRINSTTIVKALECELENINYKKTFRDLEIIIAFRTIHERPFDVYNPKIVAVSPSMIIPDSNCISMGGTRNKYLIPALHPHAKYILKLITRQNISINEYPKLYIKAEDDVRLTETDLLVVLLKHQILINVILFVFWLILIFSYLQTLMLSKK